MSAHLWRNFEVEVAIVKMKIAALRIRSIFVYQYGQHSVSSQKSVHKYVACR